MKVPKVLQNGTIAIIVGVGASGVYLFGLVSLELYVTFLGLGGSAGIAGLRAAIQSSGLKTYFIAGGGIITSLAVALGLAPVENAAVILGILGIGAIATLAAGIKKSK